MHACEASLLFGPGGIVGRTRARVGGGGLYVVFAAHYEVTILKQEPSVYWDRRGGKGGVPRHRNLEFCLRSGTVQLLIRNFCCIGCPRKRFDGTFCFAQNMRAEGESEGGAEGQRTSAAGRIFCFF